MNRFDTSRNSSIQVFSFSGLRNQPTTSRQGHEDRGNARESGHMEHPDVDSLWRKT